MDELISIIITVYNNEKFIGKCIESVIRQKYNNLQIILVDDDSIDSSGEICRKYASSDERILYVTHDINSGLSVGRNTGISHAKGEYLSFIDGDDYVADTFIETLYSTIKKYDADISMCDPKRMSPDDVQNKEDNADAEVTVYVEPLMMTTEVNWTTAVVAWNKLYKKTLFDNIRYLPNKVHEDEYIIHQLLAEAKKLVHVHSEEYYYVQHDSSTMRNESGSSYNDGWLSLFERIQVYSDHKLYRERIIWLRRLADYTTACYKGCLKLPDADVWCPLFKQRLLLLLRSYPEIKALLYEDRKILEACISAISVSLGI